MMKLPAFLPALPILVASVACRAEECASGAVMTHENYLHGRFETRMRSVDGDGVVSAFFLYNIDLNCNWPEENNEIDIEMTGNRDSSVQFTTHYPNLFSSTHIAPMPFNPHTGMHDYAIEWEPGIVRWFVDGQLTYVQNQAFVSGLVYPMRIMMNLWGVNNPDWAGNFDESIMPATASYEYVRYYAYTPGAGNAGTDDNFSLQWSDDFDGPIDTDRWEVSEFGGFGGNLCTFVSNNVDTNNGQLNLNITDPLGTTHSLVHFSVDASSLNLGVGDTVFLNGGFNNWCGNCAPMSDPDGDDVWELTVNLPAGNHEYLYTTNGWNGEVGGAPQGSSCDFQPCDEYTNYGLSVPYGSGPLTETTYCWASCNGCPDADLDGVPDSQDNCPQDPNPLQEDNEGDAVGDVCDIDDDNDGISDEDEMNYDGDPAYNPLTDTDPLSSDTDSDSYTDDIDPVPLHFNFDDGDVAPWGAPDGSVNAGDLLIQLQFVIDLKQPSALDLSHGDLHPPGAPDGSIGLSDYRELLKLILAN